MLDENELSKVRIGRNDQVWTSKAEGRACATVPLQQLWFRLLREVMNDA